MKTQIGISSESDFNKRTWTFYMPKNFSVSAGEFAILKKDKYEKLLIALKGIRNSMNVHPDCEVDSEFADMVDRCDDVLSELDI